ncbi:MAG: hypothetical protein INF91_11620 [Alphaproteobacteria bacterium]|nr:hypothetical protein [Alphaproteobacteria bacterium]MCA3570685.1 hypothetical protein [Bradyrhizobium sp.]
MGVRRIAAERQEQIELHRFTPAHDLGHGDSELLQAAAAYLLWATSPNDAGDDEVVATFAAAHWPWEAALFKPSTDARKNLAKAGALIAAEIDRLHAMGVRRG